MQVFYCSFATSLINLIIMLDSFYHVTLKRLSNDILGFENAMVLPWLRHIFCYGYATFYCCHYITMQNLKTTSGLSILCMVLYQSQIRRHMINYTVVPTKSDSDAIFCLQLLSTTLTCTLHLS